jgi:hypothetical protein
MKIIIGLTVIWITAILIGRGVHCWRFRHKANRRKKNQLITFKDRRRRW